MTDGGLNKQKHRFKRERKQDVSHQWMCELRGMVVLIGDGDGGRRCPG